MPICCLCRKEWHGQARKGQRLAKTPANCIVRVGEAQGKAAFMSRTSSQRKTSTPKHNGQIAATPYSMQHTCFRAERQKEEGQHGPPLRREHYWIPTRVAAYTRQYTQKVWYICHLDDEQIRKVHTASGHRDSDLSHPWLLGWETFLDRQRGRRPPTLAHA